MGAKTSTDCLFIQFARAPVEGAVKTRMQPVLDGAAACDLHRELVRWTAMNLCKAALGPVELWVAGEMGDPLFESCLAAGVSTLFPQSGENLGQRMYRAIANGLERYQKVVLVGSDCPSIDRGYLESALQALDDATVVLGPAEDGGYVLIGAKAVSPAMFDNITWGESTVYAATARALDNLGWCWEALPALADIDRPEDLPVWHALRGSGLPGA